MITRRFLWVHRRYVEIGTSFQFLCVNFYFKRSCRCLYSYIHSSITWIHVSLSLGAKGMKYQSKRSFPRPCAISLIGPWLSLPIGNSTRKLPSRDKLYYWFTATAATREMQSGVIICIRELSRKHTYFLRSKTTNF